MSELDVTGLVFPYPARVHRLTIEQRRTDLMTLLESSGILDPAILEERQPFFWDAEISNTLLDAYYTHMMLSTLRNFVADALAGVSFVNSHRHMELPFGRSLDANLVERPNRTSALAGFYTLPGLTLNGVSTDDLIMGMRSGIVSDVSVGLFGGDYWCDICKGNYFSYQCPHIVGLKYEVKDDSSDAPRQIVATVGIDDARLSEVSAVFDGATPNAAIIKAERMAATGELRSEAIRVLEARYRVKLPTKRQFAGVDTPGKDKQVDYEKLISDIRAALAIDEQADLVGAVTGLASEVEQLRSAGQRVTELEAQVAELTPRANDGDTYRADLVAEALAEGVRAYGDKFDAKTYEPVLKSAALDAVKRFRDDWAAVGNARFPGGRQTTDKGEQAPARQTTRRHRAPDRAYAV